MTHATLALFGQEISYTPTAQKVLTELKKVQPQNTMNYLQELYSESARCKILSPDFTGASNDANHPFAIFEKNIGMLKQSICERIHCFGFSSVERMDYLTFGFQEYDFNSRSFTFRLSSGVTMCHIGADYLGDETLKNINIALGCYLAYITGICTEYDAITFDEVTNDIFDLVRKSGVSLSELEQIINADSNSQYEIFVNTFDAECIDNIIQTLEEYLCYEGFDEDGERLIEQLALCHERISVNYGEYFYTFITKDKSLEEYLQLFLDAAESLLQDVTDSSYKSELTRIYTACKSISSTSFESISDLSYFGGEMVVGFEDRDSLYSVNDAIDHHLNAPMENGEAVHVRVEFDNPLFIKGVSDFAFALYLLDELARLSIRYRP